MQCTRQFAEEAFLKRHHFLTMFVSGVAKNTQRTSPMCVPKINLPSDAQHGAPVVQQLPVPTGPRVRTVSTTAGVPETQQGGEEEPRSRHGGGGRWRVKSDPGRCRLLSRTDLSGRYQHLQSRTEREVGLERAVTDKYTRLERKYTPQ